ncbi:ferritin-like protein [Chitinophaga skermanii]|uniref:Ferritin-like protein n=1 Tax=Chitinophaga skermanii TaxID=331697 RepID=A0A327QXN1_9BACT|nr:ferritin-like domain-containing protein [Chitinophaga skermanii]RAJ08548.1 ferritin-like protein [Chitinophaga skermanii]
MTKILQKPEEKVAPVNDGSFSRRKFLRYAAIFGGITTAATVACNNDTIYPDNNMVSLGGGDIGILNYAYALEQLEAAFYLRVVETPYAGITDNERTLLTSIRDHEVAHREFFKRALTSSAIPALEVNFSAIDFSKRDSVLATAKAFEDLGVSAYNGAGRLITSPDYLVLAGKIVSVEARHAALIRDLISNGTFANEEVVTADFGLEKSKTPKEVLAVASAFIKTQIDASKLPS